MPTKPEDIDPAMGQKHDGEVDERPDPVLTVEDLAVHFALQGNAFARLFGMKTGLVKALDGVSLEVKRGEVLGLVGESGSGKTTLGRAFLGLAPASAGSITYHAHDGDRSLRLMGSQELRRLRTNIQMVFQDPSAALNPSMTIGQAVGHPLVIHKIASGANLARRVREVLEQVGLSPVTNFVNKYPSDLSGGQKQRAVIARAIILNPEVVVADEPVSMLDMSVRAKILQLMLDLKRDLGLTYLYITHDLASAKFICDRIAIMYLGRIVEIGPTEEIFANPRHPYTKALLQAIPDPDPERSVARELPRGEIPDAAAPPLGCSFHPRCAEARAECGWESRDLRTLLEEHWTRRDPGTYEAELSLLGKLDALDKPAASARLKGDPIKVEELLARIRAEDPDEPFWRGVDALGDVGGQVQVDFHPGVDPQLRRAGGVDVACVLYPEGASEQE